ncbi:hypothetical protein ES288_A02G110400v1 [Gossypium darwinii]|uniref:Uncharacterized protein n=1 Tax=Gossypium darwinii TaxID=34276 RepID=A0A5D2HCG3_GOSDA|nr:hypothetical protein ES288_A02G110400v1 [Gossypium darwinii]
MDKKKTYRNHRCSADSRICAVPPPLRSVENDARNPCLEPWLNDCRSQLQKSYPTLRFRQSEYGFR